jgi:hypothetical protein
VPGSGPGLGAEVDAQCARLLELRARLVRERQAALSPAIARALQMAEMYLFLSLGYVGYTGELSPDELSPDKSAAETPARDATGATCTTI